MPLKATNSGQDSNLSAVIRILLLVILLAGSSVLERYHRDDASISGRYYDDLTTDTSTLLPPLLHPFYPMMLYISIMMYVLQPRTASALFPRLSFFPSSTGCTVTALLHGPPERKIMRYLFLGIILQLLTLLAQATLSAAFPRWNHDDQHGGRPHFSFPVHFTSIPTPDATSSILVVPTVSTSDPQPVPKPTPTPTSTISVQSFQDAVQVTSTTASPTVHSSPAAPTSSFTNTPVSVSRPSAPSRSSSLEGPSSNAFSAPASIPSNPASNSPKTSPIAVPVSSTQSNKSRILIEIIIPVIIILVALLAGIIVFAVYRRRVRDKKGWEGSHLPELDTPGLWRRPFGNPRDASKDARARGGTTSRAYLGGGDWNRSNAHLRGDAGSEHEKDAHSINNGSGVGIESFSESQEYAWGEPGHSDVGHDFMPAFYSKSPLHEQDEPALAESRPATLLAPLPVPHDVPQLV
ncbi:hypothetical protein C8R44DRAFT_982979 [Mycena epipterygia]|nr:hypothetical protein C8R44DRAFT_982979 [Mycena epipterygia]